MTVMYSIKGKIKKILFPPSSVRGGYSKKQAVHQESGSGKSLSKNILLACLLFKVLSIRNAEDKLILGVLFFPSATTVQKTVWMW